MWKDHKSSLSFEVKNGQIKTFDRSQTSEKLKLVGFGCSVHGCNWKFKSTSITDFRTALANHGSHNSISHTNDLSSVIMWEYK